MKRWARGILLLVVATAIAVATTLTGVPGQSLPSAVAADASQFNPGMIITDSLFYNGSAMNGNQVQSFLQAKATGCGGPGTCMPLARQTTPNMPSETGLCSGYTGAANERVADIIARVGQSCGISQKVLLVLIQKEQSLVTSSVPTQYGYDHATGFNCPDSPPGCDPAYAGFFFQVWYAARQYKNYVLNATHFNYLAGRVNNIRYSTNPTCGSLAVYIQNNATAGLYDYTPYTPDGPALANLYGSGGGCSSYGNRNFWRLYTDWFGPTNVGAGQDAINGVAAASAAALGPATQTLACDILATQCSQTFTNGTIFWSIRSGAWPVYGSMLTYYLSGDNALTMGYPTSAQFVTTGGLAQSFFNAVLYSGPPGIVPVYGGLQTAFTNFGGLDTLGWPTAHDKCGLPGAGCTQSFQTATILYSATFGSQVLAGHILSYFLANNEVTNLGYPSGAAAALGSGSVQKFAQADVYDGPAGTYAVYGRFATALAGLGGPTGSLGWPTADNVCGLAGGGCAQEFEHGGLYFSSSTATLSVPAPLDAVYQGLTGPSGVLGYPVGTAVATSSSGGGTVQGFQHGSIYSSPAGAFAVSGIVFSQYQSSGGPAGPMGWPTSAYACDATGACVQSFQGGSLKTSAIDAFVAGAAATLGAPLGDQVAIAGGHERAYAFGSVYSSGAGTFGVYGKINTAYLAAQGPGGHLGWPTAGDHCGLSGGGCSQSFQNGSIYYSPSAGTFAVSAGDAFYATTGGPGGSLGYPVAGERQLAGGTAQTFSWGTIYTGPAGSHAVYGVLSTAFTANGGPSGALGWPTAENQCGLLYGGCSQSFQTGSLYWASPYGSAVVPTTIDTLYRTTGGPNGSLGYPTGVVVTPSGGTTEPFVWGTIYAGPSGTYAVYGSIRTAYVAAGGTTGSLGWPISGDSCTAGTCTQQFQHGSITR